MAALVVVLLVLVTFFACAFADDFVLDVLAVILAAFFAALLAALLAADFATLLTAFLVAAGLTAPRTVDLTAALAAGLTLDFAAVALAFAGTVRDVLRADAVEAAALDRLAGFLLEGIRGTLLWRPLWRRADLADARVTKPAMKPAVRQTTGTLNLGYIVTQALPTRPLAI